MALSVSTSNLVDLGPIGLTGYPFTMAGWFRVPDVPYLMSLVFVRNTSYTSFHSLYFEGYAQKQVMQVSKNIATGVARTSAAIVPGSWHHIAGVFESSTSRRVYLDGGNLGVDTTDVVFATADVFLLGSFSFPEVVDVAEFAILGTALDEQAIQSLASGMTPLSLANLDAILAYHNCLSQLNHPGWGPVASSPSGLPSTDHPRVLQSRGGYPGQPRRFRGPHLLRHGELHSSGSAIAQSSSSVVDLSPEWQGPAGIVSTGTAHRGEVSTNAHC